ncbi:pentatricopeptide repeat-containing protein At5g66500, mitochondrial [Jatropha curcas]|uniref:pentatricopeptide repeat-containing protein At5g66500, mitochondrial n=1 Tax=Jatropha curcas TaxID=180498 RepID=UPI0005FADD8B|nr:pentatricopeptide repeat-containing protein At5g66500, mitochondrial [Jatropha curcas]XP_020540928.1 pentatricopeptide repeat-containing protein At5g66500, mitochondrial [Jatropha curcas]XP_020540929.1 pentatricopeptide repeat-containing protein At5g66500, mitochondrial [Jatropha curcas]XP_020540930.1 pentatricopeptide repeat-containing protein At5g66500, mitochondrial [Jatropha curcas]XP_037496965.1 pentatricopeptide repeat-containing protein At5g66500, mitochondrial [Jatropha curcas]
MFTSRRSIRYLNVLAAIPINGNSKTTTCIFSIARFHYRYAQAYNLFDTFPQRELYSLNSQLASFTRNGNFLATWSLFCDMHSACLEFDPHTFTPLLSACSALLDPKRGKQVHALMIKNGIDLGTVTKTAVVNMYSKYGYLSDSIKAFEEVEYPDVVTWNSLLSSFLRHSLVKEAFGVFGAMRKEGVEFSEFTLCSLLKACTSFKAFRLGKQVHGLVVVMSRDLVVLGTALIDFYSSVGHVSEAMKVFSSLSWRKDNVMCNSLIAGCIQNRQHKQAFAIMSTMKPNVVALTSALVACSENSDLRVGMQIHCVATRFGFTSETQLCNKLVDMYAKCGKILTARSLFDRIRDKDVVSWTSIIDAYGRHGHGQEGLELFKKMGQEGTMISPNSVTFLAVLSACGHSGLVEEGRELFNLVREKYGLEPGVEHYSCCIDILGRAGRIEDVWHLFHDMNKNGTRPSTEIWAALLNACRLNLDVLRGEFAAKQLLELQPNNPANYVMLSNFYASVGRWDLVESLRSHMKDNALIKEAGSSWVSVAH